jgi:hypothetical protein
MVKVVSHFSLIHIYIISVTNLSQAREIKKEREHCIEKN